MPKSRENRISQIFDEVGRGSSLPHVLGLIADQLAADIGAPTCKIWVVKRGDICDECPLADSCSNRQMCMHLIAASGAVVDREYPRIPLSVFTAPLITRGGTASFSDSADAGDMLFGLQRSTPGQNSDSYALYPLRGPAGTVGLIGVFNHRRFRQDELRMIEDLAPAAVAAIRVAELQTRCQALHKKIEQNGDSAAAVQQTSTHRELELEDAVAHLTHQVAQLQVENETAARTATHLTKQNKEFQARVDMLITAHHQSGQEASAMAYEVEAERRRLDEENAQLRRRIVALEASLSEITRVREQLTDDLASRTQQVDQHKAHIAALQERNSALEVTNVMLRGENASVADTANDLEHSLRLAEDSRSRFEQTNLALEQRVAGLVEDLERLGVENNRSLGENEQLVAETEKLNSEILRLHESKVLSGEENNRLITLNSELTEALSRVEEQAAKLEEEQAELTKQLEETRTLTSQQLEEARTLASQELEEARTLASQQLDETRILASQRLGELEQDNALLAETRARLEREAASLASRIEELKQDNDGLTVANTRLQEVVTQFESLSARLEDTALKLRGRAEAGEAARGELEQRNRVVTEQNRRLLLDAQTKARFLANMSHELRTPMNAIIGFTSLLLDDRSLQLNDRHRRNLERVSRNAHDLLELINNVLDLSKIEAGRMDVYAEPADARDLIERALGVVESLTEGRAVKLSFKVEDGLPAMRTDRTKLQQILINLLSNAIKFTHEGEVKVGAERVDHDRVRITVSDTGVGIAEKDISRIFEEFHQIANTGRGSRSGTGLGLAITRRLVEMLGGEITVSSRVGEGSNFVVTLPLETEGRVAQTTEAEMPLTDPDLTALVIDSDPASLYLTKKYLTEAGYSVAATDDPERGFEIADKAKPAIITIDLDEFDGASGIIERITNSHTEGSVIAFSGDPDAEERALNAGATAFLRKPIDRVALIGLIERAKLRSLKCILVVDDDPDALDLAVAMIEGNGYLIQTATSGREALEAIERQRPDAIILDLMLPEMDGFEVVHRMSLNPDWRTIPVILLTARDLSHEERRALDMGTARIIQKGTFSRDELQAEMRVALGAGESAPVAVSAD